MPLLGSLKPMPPEQTHISPQS